MDTERLNKGAWQLYGTVTRLNKGAWQGQYSTTPTPPTPTTTRRHRVSRISLKSSISIG